MRTQNKGTRSSHSRITTIAIAVASSFAITPAWAADTAFGSGNGVAYGTGSQAAEAIMSPLVTTQLFRIRMALLALPLEILQLGITLEPITTSTRAAALLLVKTPSLKTWRGRRSKASTSIKQPLRVLAFWV